MNLVHSNNNHEYVSFWKRVTAIIIDVLVLTPLVVLYYIFKDIFKTNVFLYVVYISIGFIYRIFFNVKFGGTVGKIALKTRIAGTTGNVSLVQAIRREIIYLAYTTGFVLTSYSIIVGSLASIFSMISFIIILVDGLSLLFNEKKRTLHDYIADTYVIRR